MVAAGIHTLYSGYATIEICASPGALANYMPVAAPRTPRFLIVSALARERERERECLATSSGRQICFGHFSRSDVPGVIEKRPRINYGRRVHTFREQACTDSRGSAVASFSES